MVVLQHDGSVHSDLPLELGLRENGGQGDAERAQVVVVSALDCLVGADFDQFGLDIEQGEVEDKLALGELFLGEAGIVALVFGLEWEVE